MIRPQKKLIIILPVLIFAVVLTILLVRKWSGDDRSVIKVSGNIELKDAQIGFKIAGRVLERMVSEGESIDSGQVVARPDSLDLAQEVALRKAGNSYWEKLLPYFAIGMFDVILAVVMGEFLFEVPLRGNVALLLTHLIPARYFVALLKGIYLKGIGLNILFMEAGLLSLFGVLMFALANVKFKKKLE